MFEQEKSNLFKIFDGYKKMVLSTAAGSHVTSRMMSVIIIGEQFYFQTDAKSRKYNQIKINPQASLCFDNIQIEGICEESGHPLSHPVFCELYKKYYSGSYEAYTHLKNERLFSFSPTYIQKWIYEDKKPFTEIFNFSDHTYKKVAYDGE